VENVADYLFDRSRGAARAWPKRLAEILELLVWAMDDNGAEVMAAVERWLQSDDLDRVRVALEVEDVFPFRRREEMEAVLALVKARWPQLAQQCDQRVANRAALPVDHTPVPDDVQQRIERLRELLRRVLA
jgi:hypothetical protein